MYLICVYIIKMNINKYYIIAFILLCISIPGIILLIKPLFTNKNIKLSNIEAIISKITLIAFWISLVASIKTIISIICLINNSIIKKIVETCIAIYYLFMLYGLYKITITVFAKNGIYINNNTNFTINCMKLAIIYGCISLPIYIFYDVYYDFMIL